MRIPASSRWLRILAITALLAMGMATTAQEAEPPPELSPLDGFGQRLSGIDEQVKSNQIAIEGAQKTLTDLDNRLNEGLARIDPLSVRLDGLAEELKRADQQLEEHEARLEENGIKLFETLMGIGESEEALRILQNRLDALSRRSAFSPIRPAPDASTETSSESAIAPSQESSPLLTLILGLMLPIGAILFLNASPTPSAPVSAIGSGLLSWLIGSVGYLLIGGGLMLGDSPLGLIGYPSTVLAELWNLSADQVVASDLLRTLSLHLPLAGFAALLFGSASAGRLGTGAGLLAALLMGALLYPLLGHWMLIAPGAGNAAQPIGWLATVGVRDTGGALGLAALGGIGALALAWGLGRYPNTASEQQEHGISQGIGALLLWGTWLAMVLTWNTDQTNAPWLLIMAIIAALGALVAVALSGLVCKEAGDWERGLAGGVVVGGLIASTAYPLVGILSMLLLGLLAGTLYAVLLPSVRRRLGVHADLALVFAVGGSVGALTPGLFGPEGLLTVGVLNNLGFQALGLAVVLAMALLAGRLLAHLLRTLPGHWGIINP